MTWSFPGSTKVKDAKGEKAKAQFQAPNRPGTASYTLQVTDEDGDTTSQSVNYNVRRRRRRGDPLIFDLNGDNKIELTGEAGVSNGISLPSGLWRLTVKSTAEQTRFTVADTNQGQGTYNGAAFAQVDINATGGWKIGTELVTGSAEDGDWAEQTSAHAALRGALQH